MHSPRGLLATVGASLLLCATPAAASAWTPPGDQSSTAAHTPIVGQVIDVAERFWSARHVPVCPVDRLDVRLADDLTGGVPWQHAYGRGELMPGGCPATSRPVRVWLLASLVRRAAAAPSDSDPPIFLCRVAVLEVAHTGGLDDAGPGLPGGDGVLNPASDWKHGTPWDCRVWARRAAAASRERVRGFARRRVALLDRR